MAFVPKLDGRIEKRLPIAIIVRLNHLQSESPATEEIAYTNDVSTHGACVISDHLWRLGEMVKVTALDGEVPLNGKVVHCHKHTDNHYAVGFAFKGDQATWSRYRRYACT